MTYLILEMLVFLLVAFLLGLILGWLLNRGKKVNMDKNESTLNEDKKMSSYNDSNKKITDKKPEEKPRPIVPPTPVEASKADNPNEEQGEDKKIEEAESAESFANSENLTTYNATVNVKGSEKEKQKNSNEEATQADSEEQELKDVTFKDIDLDSVVDLKSENYAVETIEGIGPKTGQALRMLGIKNVADMLNATSTVEQRKILASKLYLKQEYIDNWTSMADLLRIDGLDHQSAELIKASGVKNVTQLAQQKNEEFHDKLKIVNEAKSKLIAPEVPSAEKLSSWISQASNMQQVVSI